MRLLHPRTIEILASHPEFPKTNLAHAWSEVFKYLASGHKHPKMFIKDEYSLGIYLSKVYHFGMKSGCKFDSNLVLKHKKLNDGFNALSFKDIKIIKMVSLFDDNYLFSDACYLYYKGINIFPDIFGDEWEKYCPVISLKEIKRQVDKTLNK